MQVQPYLIFSLDNRRYSINSVYLEEMLPLPEITLLPSAAQDIVGVLNLRGDIIPILDLNLSLGQEATPYRTADSVIILNQDQLRVGLIVSSIGELENRTTLEIDASDTRLQAHREVARRKQMITGTMLSTETADSANSENPCWLLSAPEQWLRYVEIQQLMSVAGVLEENPAVSAELSSDFQPTIFCPDATSEERAIFQQRALSLRQPLKTAQSETLSTLAVITLGDCYYAVELSAVKEFTDIGIQEVTPIPCCPPHIIGNINLRGEVLTIVDIQTCLTSQTENILNAVRLTPLTESKVMVIEVDQYVIGVVVENVLEAMFPLRQEEMMNASHQEPQLIDRRYLQGEFFYRDTTVGILNFPAILSAGALDIDEVV